MFLFVGSEKLEFQKKKKKKKDLLLPLRNYMFWVSLKLLEKIAILKFRITLVNYAKICKCYSKKCSCLFLSDPQSESLKITVGVT